MATRDLQTLPELHELQDLAQKLTTKLVRKAQSFSGLKRVDPCLKQAKPASAVEVALIGAEQMTRLNRKYRRKNTPTDVLSFPAPEIFREHGRLGELVVCYPVLKSQAVEQGHTAAKELEILLAHGLLHLLGLDHERSPEEAKKQAIWEQKLLGRTARKGLLARSDLG